MLELTTQYRDENDELVTVIQCGNEVTLESVRGGRIWLQRADVERIAELFRRHDVACRLIMEDLPALSERRDSCGDAG
ncbi:MULTISPECIES: hypothetical protein [unclassified Minwuia]|uniref:hypothetical protein n=1 Tax=unclassified Minwuia TaxID=2618799 RepID=UPI00247B164C|nr:MULTISPECIES: hypothetical protein [unclassified Minwuia]